MRRFCHIGACLGVAAVTLAACAGTSKVADGVSTEALAQEKRAIALMRVGAASANCVHVGVLIGVREGEGYRRRHIMKVANVRSLNDAPVAEMEFEPGEYHVIGYSCVSEKGPAVMTDKASGDIYRTSYASFTLAAGEIVNVGHLHINASHVGRGAFGRPLDVKVSVSDWGLSEIERFRKQRPALFAAMRTRLMTVTYGAAPPPEQQDAACARYRALQAEGKVQDLPPECRPPATAPAPSAPSKKKPVPA